MVRFLERCRFALATITLMMAGNAFAQEKGEAILWTPRYRILYPCAAIGPNLAEEPATFEFQRKSGPAQGRKEAFDVRTQAYYLHVEDIARFEIKAVTPDVEKRAFILNITGMLAKPEGPLTLIVPEKGGKNKEFKLYHQGFDKELFRIERKDGVTTIEFLPKGRQLLRPGVQFQYIDAFRN